MNIRLLRTNGTIDLNSEFFLALSKEEQAKRVVEDLLTFDAHLLGKCYTPNTYAEIIKEPEKTTNGRKKFCLEKQHHSGFEHSVLTFEMDKVPKIIFMLLNNENLYVTSEQSARYTSFENAAETLKERELYIKWQKIFEQLIKEKYEMFTDKEITKLAQENARYMISSFVPSSMMHTVNLRQLNYEIRYFEKFLKGDWVRNKTENAFLQKITPVLKEFLEEISYYRVEGLEPKEICELSFFKPIVEMANVYSDVYAFTYKLSIAAHAQNHRHRTIRYRAVLLEEPEYFVPRIIRKTKYEKEWLEDIASVADEFPQGMKIMVREQGNLEDFILKCYERLCGKAQCEIMEVTTDDLIDYISYSGDVIREKILSYTNDCYARCMFNGYKCKDPCKFGSKQVSRLI